MPAAARHHRRMLSFPRPSRSTLVLGLLVAILALGALLAWQAYSALRARSQLMKHVIDEYSALAVASYQTRMTGELEYYAFEPALAPLRAARRELPSPAPIEVWTDPRTKLSIDLVDTYFRMPAANGDGAAAFEQRGRQLSPARRDQIVQALRRSLQDGEQRGWTMQFVSAPGESARAIVYETVRDTVDHTVAIRGFDASPSGLRVFLDYSFSIAPLIPAVLTRNTRQDSLVSIELVTREGIQVYRSPWVHESSWHATRRLGARFDSLEIRAALAPDAMARILPPGPSALQIGWLIALCAVCGSLLVISILQVRREAELHRLRSDFVFSVSHELRTPLAQIRLFAETLRLGRVRSEDERRRTLEILDEEATRLTHLVENVLAFSRAERRALKIAPEPTALAPLLREIAAGFEPLAAAQGMRLSIDLDGESCARVDRDAMRQIVLNLLDNAVKYGRPGQTITLRLRTLEHAAEVAVEDQGPGIAPEQAARVWDRFVRLPQAEGMSVTGVGLGLSVVRELALLHGGAVRIEPVNPAGARFVIRLPRERNEH